MKDIKDISASIYPTADFNLKEASEKGIGTESEYKEAQNIYLFFFSEYLNSIYDFKQVDATLNAKGFKPVKKKNYYQQNSQLESEYIYIRNNVHPERLTQKDIEYLITTGKKSGDEHAKSIVKNTNVDVMSIQLNDSSEKYRTSYERSNSKEGIVSNDALVLYVSYEDIKEDDNEYVKNGNQEAQVVKNDVILPVESALKNLPNDVEVFNTSW
ncbi:hypothetical protein [Listeria sp. ILCC797]|uniref:hypothetical protein n=1 Tax=Listeria sp. ILCC797 TaxID=1918333 RepID=UPI000B58ACC6|nr:hypothetical protein [Listeria sp. ILCC797]